MKAVNIVPVILSGGSGTRLWPLSRSRHPKQFIQLFGDQSLFQTTIQRLQGIENLESPVIVCNQDHRFLVAEQLDQLDVTERTIILEPVSRNTAAAVCAAAVHVQKHHPNSLLLVLPADHIISDQQLFHKSIYHALDAAQNGGLVAFGISPDLPVTGYGYIQIEKKDPTDDEDDHVFEVNRFIEKPDRKTAKKYLKDKRFYWNSGIVLYRSDVILDQLDIYHPETKACVKEAYDNSITDLGFIRLDSERYEKCECIAIEYAVMEHSKKVVMVPMLSNWTDAGTWSALWRAGKVDKAGNFTHGDVWLDQVSDSFIYADHKMVSAVGLENIAIIETKDSVLVVGLDKDQDTKNIVNQLVESGRIEAELHRQVYRPWGSYDSLDTGDGFQVKRICVKSGEAISLQKHKHRSEHWVVVHGVAEVTLNDETKTLHEQESIYIPVGTKHRLENPGKITLEIIEVQSGRYLGEDDIERFEDLYGRKMTE